MKSMRRAQYVATSALKKTAKKALSIAGVDVVPASRLRSCVEELHGCLIETTFPELKPTPGRTQLLGNLLGTQVSEGMFIVSYLHKALQFPGDVCEFGVAQGATSALIGNELLHESRNLWLFDSFEGLPKPSPKDVLIDDIFNLGSMENYEGTMSCGSDQVVQRLSSVGFPAERTKIVPGFVVRDRPLEPFPEQVCFAYVDFDFYEPILTVLDLLDRKMEHGGTILVDDYGHFSAGAKTAVDEFMADHSSTCVLVTPPPYAGHFCIIERRPTA